MVSKLPTTVHSMGKIDQTFSRLSSLRMRLITTYKGFGIASKQSVTRSAISAYSALRLYPAGTLLFAMYGATIGRLGILGIPATLNQACCAFAEPTLFDTRFVFYWLWMRRPILISLSTGGGHRNYSAAKERKERKEGQNRGSTGNLTTDCTARHGRIYV